MVLWEILSLGDRPYGTLTDEQVIQQVLQEKRTILNPPVYNYQQGQSAYQLMVQCWDLAVPSRPKMDVISCRLAAACAYSSRDVESDLEKAFDSRWDAAAAARQSNPADGDEEQERQSPSASLNNLHGSLDNLDERTSIGKDGPLSPATDQSESNFSAKVSAALRSLDEALAAAEATDNEDDGEEEEEEEVEEQLPEPEFRLGIEEERPEVQGEPDEDGSETSDLFSLKTDWRDKIVRGELTALVREKSRSVQDLMILTHVEPMSDVEYLASAQSQQATQEQKLEDAEAADRPVLAPAISVTSPSNTTRSPMMESDAPLLDSTDAK